MDAATALLRERGLRVSSARRLVLEALFAADTPISAERIAAGVDGRLPCSDLASVYRNLDTLQGIGLVQHVHVRHGPGLYALAQTDRGYLVCEACRSFRVVEEAELADLRSALQAAFGFHADFSHFPILGRCAECEPAEAVAQVPR